MKITTVEDLRALYAAPGARSLAKELKALDPHARRFIALSPFAVLATIGPDGLLDITPRGDAPGFVEVEDEKTLLLPDRAGNNRLDSLANIVSNPAISLLFMVPGMDETLRVNGRGEILAAPSLLARFAVQGKAPKTLLRITVEQCYFHCGKAFMRSRLWDGAAQVDRSVMPSLGQILQDQLGIAQGETQEEMLARYRETLY